MTFFVFAKLLITLPEFNTVEPLRHYVRVPATHNRYCATEFEFVTHLEGTLPSVPREPSQVQGCLDLFL